MIICASAESVETFEKNEVLKIRSAKKYVAVHISLVGGEKIVRKFHYVIVDGVRIAPSCETEFNELVEMQKDITSMNEAVKQNGNLIKQLIEYLKNKVCKCNKK